jgi:hypothetical protein
VETIVVCVLPAMIVAHGNIARSTIGPSPVTAVTVHVHSCVSNLTEAVEVVLEWMKLGLISARVLIHDRGII